MANNKTIFQRLTGILNRTAQNDPEPDSVKYVIEPRSEIIFSTNDKKEYETKKAELRQNKLLGYQWRKSHADLSDMNTANLTTLKLMYRDADLMDQWAEIGAALDLVAEEACTLSPKGRMLNIYSKSDRIKSVLEDLFINRLDLHIMLPMICRSMCKYGNTFMLLNVDNENGIKGWRQLPIHDMERIEGGKNNPYAALNSNIQLSDVNPDETKFIWVSKNNNIPYRDFQIAHFRLLTDSTYLPYGTSYLNKARRHWRMLSMMEDMMLIYRLERSVERRVFKIYVGNIDDKDVEAYVNAVANSMKRSPIIDPTTGQVDLKKNFIDMTSDYFIPVRDESAPNPIETLSGAQNLTAMDDIQYIENKLLAALRVPKAFLNFQDAQGKGQNLSLMDIRFTRTVNRVQQHLLMELNKIAIIHLYLMGFYDDLTNFTLSMNNPSSQLEMMEVDNLTKRIQAAQTAINPSNGIPIYSWHRALKEIMKLDDSEIKQILEEVRLEKALLNEIENTGQIIKRTGLFDPIDRIYGEPDAEYSDNMEADGESSGPMGAGPIGGGDFGGGLEDMDMSDEGDLVGDEGEVDMSAAADVDNGNNPPMENTTKKNGNLILENNKYFKEYLRRFEIENKELTLEKVKIYDENFLINEELNNMVNNLEEDIKKNIAELENYEDK